jgi:hypothetical protein
MENRPQIPVNIPVSDPKPPGWKPTTSTVAGAMLGGAVAQIICAVLAKLNWTPDPMTAGAITTVCTFAAGYIFPDGGRK